MTEAERIAELEAKLADAMRDVARLDFVISARTSWYPKRCRNGDGILCWGEGRHESTGATMRDAIDSAMTRGWKDPLDVRTAK